MHDEATAATFFYNEIGITKSEYSHHYRMIIIEFADRRPFWPRYTAAAGVDVRCVNEECANISARRTGRWQSEKKCRDVNLLNRNIG